jgi:microcystin-dependent protein
VTTPFVGEIQLFSFGFAPVGWALCDGSTLQIRQYTALFSLIGTTYGGNGSTTFQLPNLMARAPCSQGTGPGLTPRVAGETFGDPQVTILQSTMPSHNHVMTLFEQTDSAKRVGMPATNYGVLSPGNTNAFVNNVNPNVGFSPNTIGPTGNNLPHENRQPYLALNFCIALQGDFPSFG